MIALVRQLLDICLLRRGPQDLPHWPAAALGLVGALLVVQLAFASHQGLQASALAARAVVTLVILLGVTFTLLARRGLQNRGTQTLTALAGTGLLFSLAMMPLAMAMQPYLEVKEPPARVLLLALAAMVLVVWKVRVEAAIWRQALDVAATPALLLTLALMLGEATLLFLLAPTPVPAAP